MGATESRRVLRSKAAARRAYDRMSLIYDWLTAGEAYVRNRLLRVAAIQQGERVLDLGTGTGSALPDLARVAGRDGLVMGLDLSMGMLGRARKRMGATVDLIQGDAANLPLAEASFDVVFMSFSLELFDTPEFPGVLSECGRVLRADGRLVVGCLASRPKRTWPVPLYEWLHDRYPAWLDCRPIPVRALLTESGFRLEAVVESQLWGLPVDFVVARSPGKGG